MTTAPTKSAPKEIATLLNENAASIEKVLPHQCKGQGVRLINRFASYVMTSDERQHLRECLPNSLVMCCIKAAEFGLPVDGKLGHAVAYRNKHRDNAYEAQFMPDYKGLIAVAKRLGLIEDCWARVVNDGDKFRVYEEDGHQRYEFEPRFKSSNPTCVYAIARHKDGWLRWEVMDIATIEGIRARSKAKDSGPWITDWGEMGKKTVLRRLLKTFTDDPGFSDLLAAEDGQYGEPVVVSDAPADSLEAVTQRLLGDTESIADAESAIDKSPNHEVIDGEKLGEFIEQSAKILSKAKTKEELQESLIPIEADAQLQFGKAGIKAAQQLYDDLAKRLN